MSQTKKLVIVLLGGLGGFAILVAAGVVASHFVDLQPLRERVTQELSRRFGGTISMQALHLSFVPLPHVTVDQVSVSVPGVVEGTIASLSLYPKVLELLRGRLQLAKLSLHTPDLTLHLPPPAAAEHPAAPPGAHPFTLAALKDTLSATLASIASTAVTQLPGLVLDLHDGTIRVATAGGAAFPFTNVEAAVDLPVGLLSLELTCGSTLWEQLELNASLDPHTLKGSAAVELRNLHPQLLNAQLFADGNLQLGDSTLGLAAHVDFDGSGAVQATLHGAVPSLTVRRGADTVVLRADKLEAKLHSDAQTTGVEISTLRLAAPRLQLSGRWDLHHTTPMATLDIHASDLDIASVHRASSVLLGNGGLAGDIFNVLRAGTVPQFSLRLQAPSMAQWGDRQALAIHGRLVAGRIGIPGVNLELQDVAGEASVSDGVLGGTHASGHYGKIKASEGDLRIGLSGEQRELHVETLVQADAADLPDLLRRVTPHNAAINRALDLLSDISGTATGKLILAGTTDDVAATAEGTQYNVSARLLGLNPPLQVAGERFKQDADGLVVTDANLTLGASTLSHLAVHVGMDESLTASAGPSQIVLGEVYAWLFATGWMPRGPWIPKTIEGTVAAKSMQLSGPARSPAEWKVDVVGDVQNLEGDVPPLKEHLAIRSPLHITNGRFSQVPPITSFAGKVSARGGLIGVIDMDIDWSPAALNIKRLHIRDAQSNASGRLLLDENEINFAFEGHLNKSTVNAVLPDNHLLGGWIRGDFRGKMIVGQLLKSTAQGQLEAHDLSLPMRSGERLRIENVALKSSTPRTVTMDAAIDTGTAGVVQLSGTVAPSPEAVVVDLSAKAGNLDWHDMGARGWDHSDEDGASETPWRKLLRGSVSLDVESLTYEGFTWRPLRGRVDLTGDGGTLTVTDARLCDVGTPGMIAFGPQGLRVAVQPTASDRPLEPTLKCVMNDSNLATGSFGLSGNIAARGTPAELARSSEGEIELHAANGRIYGLKMARQLLSIVNVATGSLGTLADLTKEGLPYSTFDLTGEVRGGTLVLKETVLDSPLMKMAGQGSIDLVDRKLDVTLLVAPLRNVDKVVSWIPVIGGILGGNLVTIPVRVTGKLGDPRVIPMDPAAVGTGMLRLMTRTLEMPVNAVKPWLPGERRK